jgi:hypothetical protein
MGIHTFLIGPVLLIGITVVSVVVCIYIVAKAQGNVKNLNGTRRIVLLFFACLPLILLAGIVMMMSKSTNDAREMLAEDIRSGVVIVHEVNNAIDTSKTQKMTLAVPEQIKLTFDIFEDNLYGEMDGKILRIKTREFAKVPELKKNDIGFVSLMHIDPHVFNKDLKEQILKKDKIEYTKEEVAIGTIFRYENKDVSNDESGSLVFEMFFNNLEYQLMMSVGYNTQDDLRARYSPVVSREYADKLFKVMTSTTNLEFVTKTE